MTDQEIDQQGRPRSDAYMYYTAQEATRALQSDAWGSTSRPIDFETAPTDLAAWRLRVP